MMCIGSVGNVTAFVRERKHIGRPRVKIRVSQGDLIILKVVDGIGRTKEVVAQNVGRAGARLQTERANFIGHGHDELGEVHFYIYRLVEGEGEERFILLLGTGDSAGAVVIFGF